MLLAVDIGNTNLVVGVLDQGEIRFFERVSTDLSKTALEYALCFKNILELHSLSSAEIDGAIIASVVPPLTSLITEALGKICSCRVRTVGPGLKNGLKIHMDDPALGLLIDPMIWRSMRSFTPDCVMMAVCDRPFAPGQETIDDEETWRQAVRTGEE